MKMLFGTGEIMNLEELQMLCIEIISKFQMIQMENMPVKKNPIRFMSRQAMKCGGRRLLTNYLEFWNM